MPTSYKDDWRFISLVVLALAAVLRPGTSYGASELVTGNGHGFALVDPATGGLTRFYAHPYRFMRAQPDDPSADGVPTPSWIRDGKWEEHPGRRPGIDAAGPRVSYLHESQVIDARSGRIAASYYEPFGFERNLLIAQAEASGPACLSLSLEEGVRRLGTRVIHGFPAELYGWADSPERLVVLPFGGPGSAEAREPDALKLCGRAWALLSLGSDGEVDAAVADLERWRADRSAAEVLRAELVAFEAWRKPPRAPLPSREALALWRQSETLLRMAQIRETGARAFGLIDASLPPGRWFIPWVRDMSYAVVALTEMGHLAEARAGIEAWLRAGPVGRLREEVRGNPYQISLTRYFGDGSEENDRSGAPYHNLEIDDWGLALRAMGTYFEAAPSRAWLDAPAAGGTSYETIRELVVKPLLGYLDPSGDGEIVGLDSSIWEQNWIERRHYAFSTLAAIAGLRAFVPMARAVGDTEAVAMVLEALPRLERGFAVAFVHDGVIHGTLEGEPRNEVDGALLEGVNLGVIRDRSWVAGLFGKLPRLRVASGGCRRTLGDTEYEAQEFVFIDFALARARLRLGNGAVPAAGQLAIADAQVRRIELKARADHGFIPEMYVSRKNEEFPGAIGAPAGAVPMVGYGAGAYVIFQSERARSGAPGGQ